MSSTPSFSPLSPLAFHALSRPQRRFIEHLRRQHHCSRQTKPLVTPKLSPEVHSKHRRASSSDPQNPLANPAELAVSESIHHFSVTLFRASLKEAEQEAACRVYWMGLDHCDGQCRAFLFTTQPLTLVRIIATRRDERKRYSQQFFDDDNNRRLLLTGFGRRVDIHRLKLTLNVPPMILHSTSMQKIAPSIAWILDTPHPARNSSFSHRWPFPAPIRGNNA